MRNLSLIFALLPFIGFSFAVASEPFELNIKFSNFSESPDKHCLYSNVYSVEKQAIACSDDDQFIFIADLEAGQSYITSMHVRNEVTGAYVINGSLHYTVSNDGDISIEHEAALDGLGYYHLENGFEYYLKPETALVVYEDTYFQGKSIEITKNMADLGQFKHKVHSYNVPPNWTVRFYEEKNFRGRYYTRGKSLNPIFISEDFQYYNVQSVRILSKN